MLPKMRLPLALCAAIVLCASSVSRAAPFEVHLLRPDSLVGWDHDVPGPRGWTIADGVLSGSGQSTPILSGGTFGDAQLRFRWSVAEGSRLTVLLPKAPSSKGLELVQA